MAPYLSHLLESNKIPSTSESTQLLNTLKDKNQQYLKDSEAKLEDSKSNLGETEVSDALRDKASYLAKIGEKVSSTISRLYERNIEYLTRKRESLIWQEKAVEAHEEAFLKTAGKGTKIDLVLSIIRIGFFHQDQQLISSQIDRAQKYVLFSLLSLCISVTYDQVCVTC